MKRRTTMGCYLSVDKPRSVKPILEPAHDNNLVDSMSSILPSHTDANATVNDKVRLGFVARAPQTQSLTGKLIAAAKIDDVATANELLGRYMQDADSLSAGTSIITVASLVNTRGMWGNTPLLVSAKYANLDFALTLLEKWSANATIVNDAGATTLLYACIEGLDALVVSCLAHGAIVDPPPAVEYISSLDEKLSLTPLHAASITGCPTIVSLLLDNGADIDREVALAPFGKSYDECPCDTAFGYAIQYAQSAVAQALVARSIMDNNSVLPPPKRLLQACMKRNHFFRTATDLDEALAKTIRIYPEPARSADVNALDETGATALHAACRRKFWTCVTELVQVGANVNAMDGNGSTPASIVSRLNNDPVLKFLKERGGVNQPTTPSISGVALT